MRPPARGHRSDRHGAASAGGERAQSTRALAKKTCVGIAHGRAAGQRLCIDGDGRTLPLFHECEQKNDDACLLHGRPAALRVIPVTTRHHVLPWHVHLQVLLVLFDFVLFCFVLFCFYFILFYFILPRPRYADRPITECSVAQKLCLWQKMAWGENDRNRHGDPQRHPISGTAESLRVSAARAAGHPSRFTAPKIGPWERVC